MARRRTSFWILAPFFVVFIVAMPLVTVVRTQEWTSRAAGVIAVIEVVALLFLIGLYDPVRFLWAWRVTAMLVFLAYTAYVVYEAVEGPSTIWRSAPRSEPTLRNALLGWVCVGLPCLIFAFRRKGTWFETLAGGANTDRERDAADPPLEPPRPEDIA